MKVSGFGGWWAVDLGSSALVCHNSEYEADVGEEVHEHRSAGGGGWTEGLPVTRKVYALVLKVAEDDAAYPQALGFTEGAEVTFWLKRGGLAEYDKVTASIVRRVRVVNDQQRARRVEITCEHGAYARNVTPPNLS